MLLPNQAPPHCTYILHSIVGVRSRLEYGAELKDTMMMGADYYETEAWIEMEASFEQMDSTVIKDNKIHRNKYSPSAQPVDEVFTWDGSVDIHESPSIKSKSGNWRACPFILANECYERLAYYGITTSLVNYLKDGFGQSNATAANNVNNWAGTCYVTPVLGFFLADSYLG